MLLAERPAPSIHAALQPNTDKRSEYDVSDKDGDLVANTVGCMPPVASLDASRVPKPTKRPDATTLSDWALETLTSGGVLCSLPNSEAGGARVFKLDSCLAGGTAQFYTEHLKKSGHAVNTTKTRNTRDAVTYEAVTLLNGEVTELVNGISYGFEKASAVDSLIDAGFSVEVKKTPYISKDCAVQASSTEQQKELLKNEVAYTLEASARGIAPAVFAMFLATPHSEVPQSPMQAYEQLVSVDVGLDALVTMRHVSTFTLGDVMNTMTREREPALRSKMETTLSEMCTTVFSQISKLCRVCNGFSTVKLNMTPSTIAFCPALLEDGEQWKLEGHGHLPVSQTHLDGKPFITNYNAALTTRAHKDSYSPEVSLVMHSLIMLAFTKAMHGPAATKVVWKALLDDKKGFVPACRAMGSQPTNASSFLAFLARSYETRKFFDLSKVTAEVVGDMDKVVKSGLLTSNGEFALPKDTPMFTKLVTLVTGSSNADTRIFDVDTLVFDDTEEAEARAAMQQVKHERVQRLLQL